MIMSNPIWLSCVFKILYFLHTSVNFQVGFSVRLFLVCIFRVQFSFYSNCSFVHLLVTTKEFKCNHTLQKSYSIVLN